MPPLNTAAGALSLFMAVASSVTTTLAAKECGVYLAPSTIPGAGMGMFAGNKDYKTGDVVTLGDLVIPVYELEWHNNHQSVHFLWDEYVWHAGNFPGMERESEDISLVHAASGGMGAAVNCMLPLVNVNDDDEAFTMGASGINSSNPGTGAFSPYYNRVFRASKDIPAGAELYASYGENYFTSRTYNYGYLPMSDNYKEADRLLKNFQRVSKKLQSTMIGSGDNGSTILHDLYNFLTEQPSVWKESRTLNALPKNESQIEPILKSGGTSQQHYNQSLRDIAWLEENGKCMDNIKDGVSTNPYAGRGAFANRFIAEGDVVSPAPLIHISERKILTMHDSFPIKNGKLRANMKSPNHHQLMLNYCFGHEESTLLLCPYGLLTAFINHSKEKANTKIIWSDEMRHLEWREQPVEQWGKTDHNGLSFDFVALRDIEEDEEIFIDYGDDWEEAWQEHLRKFDPTIRAHYIPAFELNQNPDHVLRTYDDLHTYETDGVSVFCWIHYLELYGISTEFTSDDDNEERSGKFCRILERTGDDEYTIAVMNLVDNSKTEQTDESVAAILWGLPRDAVYFEDDFYERDHHKVWTFRHSMMIPDEIFPEVWKNAKKEG